MIDEDETEQMVLEIMDVCLQHLTMLLFNGRNAPGVLTMYIAEGSRSCVCVCVRW